MLSASSNVVMKWAGTRSRF